MQILSRKQISHLHLLRMDVAGGGAGRGGGGVKPAAETRHQRSSSSHFLLATGSQEGWGGASTPARNRTMFLPLKVPF